jgi:hypothetical protein
MNMGFDKWTDILQQTFTELGVVRVDLTSALCSIENKRILRTALIE